MREDSHSGRLRNAVSDHMTPNPITVDGQTRAAVAEALMRRHGVRHLPVVEGVAIVGLVGEPELHRAAAPDDRVDALMSRSPLVVSPAALVVDVAREMLGCGRRAVLVAADGRLIGIFTSADALAILSRPPEDPAPTAPTCDRWGYVRRDVGPLR